MIRLGKATAIIAATLLGLAVLWELMGPVVVLLISLVVASAAHGPVVWLMAHGLPKPLALMGTYSVCLLAISSLLVGAVHLASGELRQTAVDFARLYDFAASHSSLVPGVDRALREWMPATEKLLTVLVGNHGEQAVRLILGTALGLLGAVVDVVFVIVLSIYWTVDHESFERFWLSLLPLPHRLAVRKLWRTLEAELGAYARSELAQSILAGLLLGAGFYLLGLRYPTLLALVAALSWLIPWLGAIITLAALSVAELPILVFGWPGSLVPFVAAAFFTAAVFAMMEFVVEPRLFNRRRYNSLLIVLAAMALAEAFGIVGLLLGPMLAVAIQVLLEHVERQQIASQRPAVDWTALEGRIGEVRTVAMSDDEPSPEWVSILDRLAALVRQAEDVFGDDPSVTRVC